MTVREYQLFISNQFVPAAGGETFESVNPATGEPVCRVARGRETDVDAAVKAARTAFDQGPWPTMPVADRAACLLKLAEALEAQGRELGQLMIAESGATVRKAKGEVFLSGKHLVYFAKTAMKLAETEELEALSRPGVSRNLLVREPIGVCGQITPWNFPLQMIIWKIGPAVVMGNTVVLKPAEETPGMAMALAGLIEGAGFPPGVINIVTGYGQEAGAALAKHPGVDKLAFTGSTEVGKRIMHDAAEGLKPITLELGGKSANIILHDADLEMAVDGALYAAFFHSGQCCTAGTRLLVDERIHDEVVSRLVTKVKAMTVGDPADKATDIGPLVSRRQQERVLGYLSQGAKEGATVAVGGDALPDSLKAGCYVMPTILTGVNNQMAVAREEIFGPVLSVIPFTTVEEAVAIANDSPYGLAGAVWSADDATAMAVARQLQAGTVWINEYHLISEKAPFGGYKQSGIGRELGEAGLLAYTQLKHIHVDEVKDRGKKFWYDAVVPAPATTSS
ncbi:MAG: aldehyde dehydrogenase [Candidatus Melainabacteria bacterium]